MSKNETWWEIYQRHGLRIYNTNMGRHRVARRFNMGLNEARRLVYYIRQNGPPGGASGRVSVQQRTRGITHMVIGDSHAEPDQDLSRFKWAARFALEHRPDVIVQIGDHFGLTSLCYHNSKKAGEGLRVKDDLNAGNEGIRLFEDVLRRHNKAFPDDEYKPRKIVTLGNHDWRLIKQVEDSPHLEGLLSYDLMDWKKYGWEVIPFKQPIEVDGVNYCHYFSKPGSPRPISGMHHAASLVREGMGKTLVCGHSHQLQWYSKARHDGKRVHAVVVGCYFGHHEEYAGISNNTWWRGLVLLRNVKEGDFDLETWSMDRIRKRYGDVRP